MRTMRGMAWAAAVVAAVVAAAACGGDGGDSTAPPNPNELACVNPTTAGSAVTCSVTLPAAAASVKATIVGSQTCEAHGNLFAFVTPVADTLTSDGCFDTVGKEIDLGSLDAGTQLSTELKSGELMSGGVSLGPGLAAVRVSGQYPQWTISMEDAVGAFPTVADDYDDLVISVTVTPAQ